MQNRKGHRPPPRDRRRPASSRDRGYARASADDRVLLYGWHSVKAAIENPEREILAVYGTENALRRLKDEGLTLPVEPQLVRPDAIAARLTADAVHQGILAEANPLPEKDLEDLKDVRLVLVLDQVTDPHNVGAMLRSASAFAVDAIVTTARHSPAVTGVLAKAASGALEHVPIVSVQNLARGLQALKDQGFQVVGLDSDAPDDLADVALRAPLAVVLGAEGKGLRHLTRETCDTLARLDLPGAIKSLNVSNAAALTLYVATRALRNK